MMMERGLRGDERAAVRLCHWHIQNGKAQTDSTVEATLVWHELSKVIGAVIGIAAA